MSAEQHKEKASAAPVVPSEREGAGPPESSPQETSIEPPPAPAAAAPEGAAGAEEPAAKSVNEPSAVTKQRAAHALMSTVEKPHRRVTQVVTETQRHGFNYRKIEMMVGDTLKFHWFSNIGIVECDYFYKPLPPSTTSAVSRNAPESEGGSHYVEFMERGRYWFRSTDESRQEARVRVTVIDEDTKLARRMMWYGVVAFSVCAVIVAGVILGVYVVDTNVMIIPNSNGPDNPSYQGSRDMQSILLTRAVPWIAFGLVALILLLGVRIAFCLWTSHMTDFGRGYPITRQVSVQYLQYAVAIPLLVLVMALWWIILSVNNSWSEFFGTLSTSVLSTLNEALTVTKNLEFLIREAPNFIPGFRVPPSAPRLLDQVTEVATAIREYATYGEDIVRGLFRVVAILTFLSLQCVLMSASVGIVAIFRRRARLMRFSLYLMCLSFVITCFAIGMTSLNLATMERTADIIQAFEDRTLTGEDLQRATAQSQSSPIVAMFGVCLDKGFLTVDFLNTALDSLAQDFNQKLGGLGHGGGGFELPRSPSGNGTINATELLQYSDFLISQLETLDRTLQRNPAALADITPILNGSTAPIVRAAISVARSMFGLVECQIIRSTIQDASPLLRGQIIRRLEAQYGVYITVFVLHLLFIFAGFATAYVFNRPYKTWYYQPTGRWFKFHASYKAHVAVIRKQKLAEATAAKAVQKAIPSNEGSHEPTAEEDSAIVIDDDDHSSYARRVEWKNHFSILTVLDGFFSINLSNSFMLFLQAIILIILHVSYPANQLHPLLQATCVFCILIPLFSFPTELVRHTIPRAILRALIFVMTLVVMILCIVYAIHSGRRSVRCYEEIQDARHNANGTAYPFTAQCSVNNVVSSIESAVYAVTIAMVGLGTAFTSLVLLITVQINHGINPFSTEDAKEPTEYQRKKLILKLVVLVAFVFIVIAFLVAALVLLFAETVHVDAPGDDEASPEAYYLPTVGCNGHVENCAKRVDQIVWFNSHNAMSSLDADFFAPNHYHGFQKQLETGVRSFMFDFFPAPPGTPSNASWNISLCHGYCNLGQYPASRDLAIIESFLQINTTSVIMILVEMGGVPTRTTVADVVEAFRQAGLEEFMWRSNNTPVNNPTFLWPILQDMIVEDKRVMLFVDRVPPPGSPNWIHYQWDFMFENPFQASSVGEFVCDLNRGTIGTTRAIRNRKLALLNHFISAPLGGPSFSAQANTALSITQHFFNCTADWGRRPTIVAFDYWSLLNPLKTVEDISIGAIQGPF